MRSAILTAVLFLTWACPSRAVTLDVRYYNPGTLAFDILKFEVDGQPYVEVLSGCPGPGNPVTGPICVSQIQLGEGVHQVRAQAFVSGGEEPAWTVYSNTISVQGAPEPGLAVGLLLGALWLGALARRA